MQTVTSLCSSRFRGPSLRVRLAVSSFNQSSTSCHGLLQQGSPRSRDCTVTPQNKNRAKFGTVEVSGYRMGYLERIGRLDGFLRCFSEKGLFDSATKQAILVSTLGGGLCFASYNYGAKYLKEAPLSRHETNRRIRFHRSRLSALQHIDATIRAIFISLILCASFLNH